MIPTKTLRTSNRESYGMNAREIEETPSKRIGSKLVTFRPNLLEKIIARATVGTSMKDRRKKLRYRFPGSLFAAKFRPKNTKVVEHQSAHWMRVLTTIFSVDNPGSSSFVLSASELGDKVKPNGRFVLLYFAIFHRTSVASRVRPFSTNHAGDSGIKEQQHKKTMK